MLVSINLMLLFNKAPARVAACYSQTTRKAMTLEISALDIEGWGAFLPLFRFAGSLNSYCFGYMKENSRKAKWKWGGGMSL